MSKAKKKEKTPKASKQAVETAPLKKAEIKITAAKGRPMLTWVGKRPLSRVTAFPAQHVESFSPSPLVGEGGGEGAIWKDWPSAYPKGGLLFHGDNKEVLAHLLANGFRGKVNLIYIDPPFDSGADYVRKVSLRGPKGTAKIDGETYTLGEQIQYTDIWANDNYLQFMYERLMLLKELLAENGSIALHCDAKRSHFLRMLLEEVFGADNFRGELIVRAGVKNVQSQFEEMSNVTLGSNTIFLFSKGVDTKYQKLQTVAAEHEPGKWDTFWRGTDRPTMRYKLFGQKPDHGQWRWEEKRALVAINNYEQYLSQCADKLTLDDYYLKKLDDGEDLDFVRKSDDGVAQYYVSPRKYKLLSNVWLDLPYRGTITDYPTEKNEAIVERLVSWITKPGDIVLDSFGGSGTAQAVAQKHGRRWIGCDINNGAIQTTSKRLQTVILEQIEESKKGNLSLDLSTEENKENIQPAQAAFSTWRVNDYDLAIQHNEAVNLASEHIGIQRMRTDAYFDGTYRKSLVKIIPFGHPLTPLDLEELKRELEARPDEDRPITVVCLGMEIAAKAWIEDWNRLRKGKDAINKIEAIELRTDPKYGKFMKHEPAKAKVKISRKKDTISVEIEDFISPTIIERLAQQAGLLKPKIDDWRAMVDCVMIDTAYDGEVFNVTLSDVPEKRTDYVKGSYDLTALGGDTTVAVKIVDMLGEEVLMTKNV